MPPSMPSLNHLSAVEAAQWIAQGRTTAEALVRACLDRVAEREAVVGAWEYIDPDAALGCARLLDRGPRAGPLHGIPFGVKDIIDTADMPTGYGSPIYTGHRPPADAACVALSRGAGGVLLGKTVTTEFAHRVPGKTANPLNPAHTPGGSSSGSAAAVADFMTPLAIGTQTTASTVRPASFCGVVGYRPTLGDLSCSGVRQCSSSFDTLGLIARTVADCAFFRDVLLGMSPAVLKPLDAAPRIGFCHTPFWGDLEPGTASMIEDGVARLGRAGARVGEVAVPPSYESLTETHRCISSFEFARNFAYEKLFHADQLSPALLNGKMAEGWRQTFPAYAKARAHMAYCRNQIADLFGDNDILVTASAAGEAPVGLEATGTAVFSLIWTVLGVPSITIPAFTGPRGLPIGIQLVARPEDDERLFAAADWVQHHIA